MIADARQRCRRNASPIAAPSCRFCSKAPPACRRQARHDSLRCAPSGRRDRLEAPLAFRRDKTAAAILAQMPRIRLAGISRTLTPARRSSTMKRRKFLSAQKMIFHAAAGASPTPPRGKTPRRERHARYDILFFIAGAARRVMMPFQRIYFPCAGTGRRAPVEAGVAANFPCRRFPRCCHVFAARLPA